MTFSGTHFYFYLDFYLVFGVIRLLRTDTGRHVVARVMLRLPVISKL